MIGSMSSMQLSICVFETSALMVVVGGSINTQRKEEQRGIEGAEEGRENGRRRRNEKWTRKEKKKLNTTIQVWMKNPFP